MDLEYEIELMRLLCRLAVVDGAAVPTEVNMIVRRARYHRIPEDLIAAQLAAMASGGDLPAPDIAILRTDIPLTRSNARNLLAIDGVLHDSEVLAFQRLDLALST